MNFVSSLKNFDFALKIVNKTGKFNQSLLNLLMNGFNEH